MSPHPTQIEPKEQTITPRMSPTAIIIDDSAVCRALLRRGLNNAGFQVIAEDKTGERALEVYDRLRPNLIILDIVLPGMDGVTAATEILKRHPDATVVVCSSLTARDKIIACRNAGVAHFILKPFSLEKITEVVQEVAKRLTYAAAQRSVA